MISLALNHAGSPLKAFNSLLISAQVAGRHARSTEEVEILWGTLQGNNVPVKG